MQDTMYHPEKDVEALSSIKLLRQKGINATTVPTFKKLIYDYYAGHGRDFPWRNDITPYHIVVSELMLQQTQTERVVPKYIAFIKQFPDFMTLSTSSLQDILKVWQGLGYNRRALSLKRVAEIVMNQYNGILPEETDVLRALPGIGVYTAAAIRAFAFNKPDVVIETNIRTVFIYLFFLETDVVSDNAITPLVKKTIDYTNPREWYYALMDYGVMLKRIYKNPGKKSAQYHPQGRYEGSSRQLRGFIIRKLADGPLFEKDLFMQLDDTSSRIRQIIYDLEQEGFILRKHGKLYIL